MKPLLAAVERALPKGAERGWHYPTAGRAFDAADLRNSAIADGSSPNAGREVHFGPARSFSSRATTPNPCFASPMAW